MERINRNQGQLTTFGLLPVAEEMNWQTKHQYSETRIGSPRVTENSQVTTTRGLHRSPRDTVFSEEQTHQVHWSIITQHSAPRRNGPRPRQAYPRPIKRLKEKRAPRYNSVSDCKAHRARFMKKNTESTGGESTTRSLPSSSRTWSIPSLLLWSSGGPVRTGQD